MANEIAINPETGKAVRLEGGQWVDTPIAVNPQSGQRVVFDGQTWRDAGVQTAPGGAAPPAGAPTGNPMEGVVNDGVGNFATGVIKGVSQLSELPRTLVDAPANISNFVLRKLFGDQTHQWTPPSEVLGKAAPYFLPSAKDTERAITQGPAIVGDALGTRGGAVDRATGLFSPIPMRTPTTGAGRLLQDVGEGVGSLPIPGMFGFGVAQGLGSWGAGELTDQNPLAKAIGGIAGAGTYGLARALAPNSTTMLQRRMVEYTPAQLDAATALQREAAGRGVPLMAQEALDSSRLGPMAQLAGNAAAQPTGAALGRFAAERVAPGGALPRVIESELGNIAPRVTNPNEVARNLGAAAEKAVMEPQIARAAAGNAYLSQAAGDAFDATVKANTLAQIDAAIARANPEGVAAKQLDALRKQVAGAGTVEQANEALGNFRTIYKARAFEGSPVPDSVRTALKPVIREGYAGLEATNPNYLAFREVYKGQAGVPSPFSVAVEQAQSSPAARIAQAQSNPAAEGATGAFGNWLRGGNGPPPAPLVVKDEIARLAKQDPEAVKNALRAVLQRDADAAFTITKEGVAPADSAVGFVKRVAGTEDTRAALKAAVEGATGNATTAAGFDRLMTILQRTGVTPGLGSPTATRGAAMLEAGSGGAVGVALEGANVTRGSVLRTLADVNERLRAGKTWGELADLLTDPDSVAKIRQLALMNPSSQKAELLAATIVQGNRAVTGAPR